MKFKNFLLNEDRTKGINDDGIINYTIQNCKNNFKKIFISKKVLPLYRGLRGFNDIYGLVDTNKGEPRKSANTYNYMTLLMDNLPSWKNYPKRSKSIICTTILSDSKGYGKSYYVIPFDNTKIGVASSYDIWVSFEEAFGNWNIDRINDLLYEDFDYYDIKVNDSSYKSLKNGLIELNKKTDDKNFPHDLDGLDIFNKKRDIMKHLNKILNPKFNKFTLGYNKKFEKREIWIEGKSLFVSNDNIDNYIEKVKKEI